MKEVILRKGNCVLIDDHAAQQYIVGVDYNPDAPEGQQWGYGLYYPYWMNSDRKANALSDALDALLHKTDEDYISRLRLIEISTSALHELREIDEDTFIDFCNADLDITEKERDFFEIEEDEIDETEKPDRIREYIMGCLDTDDEAVECGYNVNERFIDDVVARFRELLNYVEEGYSEINAKDDAIEQVMDCWNNEER